MSDSTMDIYTPEGSKIIFTAVGGSDKERDDAKKILELGKKYTLWYSEVESYYTDIYLKEVPGAFNSCLFSNLPTYNQIECPNCKHTFKKHSGDE